jgi:DNA-directed RNA polymerase specialized sigma24 family protein
MGDENLDYTELSDTDLIQRFCTDTPDQDAFTVLWKRYEQKIHGYAQHFAIMCPDFHSPAIFAEDTFSKTQEKVVMNICGFRGESLFSTWLYRIVERTAIELRRKILGRSRKGPYVHVPVTDGELSDDSAVFQDKVKHDPFHAASKRDLKTIVRRVMVDYAGSKEGYDSLKVVCAFVIDECPVHEIAAQRCTYDKEIYRTLEHDYELLRASFKRAGVASFLKV